MSFSRQEIEREARAAKRRAEEAPPVAPAAMPRFVTIGAWRVAVDRQVITQCGCCGPHEHWMMSMRTDGRTTERDWKAMGLIASAMGAPADPVLPVASTPAGKPYYWLWSEKGECRCPDLSAAIVTAARQAVQEAVPMRVTASDEERIAAGMRPDGKMTRQAFDATYDIMKEAGLAVGDREEGWQKCLASGMGVIDEKAN